MYLVPSNFQVITKTKYSSYIFLGGGIASLDYHLERLGLCNLCNLWIQRDQMRRKDKHVTWNNIWFPAPQYPASMILARYHGFLWRIYIYIFNNSNWAIVLRNRATAQCAHGKWRVGTKQDLSSFQPPNGKGKTRNTRFVRWRKDQVRQQELKPTKHCALQTENKCNLCPKKIKSSLLT